MKTIRTTICSLLLTTLLTGNILANTGIVVGTAAVTSIFSDLVEEVLFLLRDGDCPPRLCTMCRPNSVIDENGNCRPREE